ncbi:MAG: DNA/RNA helicase domain-containing protein, partial [Planctomycetota bacterium]
MPRACYANSISEFLSDSENSILGSLGRNLPHDIEKLQDNAWIEQIKILKKQLSDLDNGHLLFEYSIPRMGKRVDNIILLDGIVFVLEFKVGERQYPLHALDQVLDYALDLKNFHEQSHSKKIVPILISTNAPDYINVIQSFEDSVFEPLRANKNNISKVINWVSSKHKDGQLDTVAWQESVYKPTPTIVEAAQALYKGHSVQEISRSDGGAINLSKTSNAIAKIIDESKAKPQKSICFITGVPGAGKTLAGLNIANERHNIDEGEHAVFLSGNGPLVQVLQEALARNKVQETQDTQNRMTKKKALSETKVFIQNIHHYRDDALETDKPPVGQVAVFDEAQRAWTLEQTSSFMKRKKGILDFSKSEPDFLIGVMDRHEDWAIIICLIGGGQEINTGEAGLPEWFLALKKDYPDWNVYVSDKLDDFEYNQGIDLFSKIRSDKLHIEPDLHLAVSVRSF